MGIKTMQIDFVRPAAALLLAGAVAGCGQAEAGDAAPGSAAADSGYVRLINVEVSPVELQPFSERVMLTGVVEANRDVTVSAEESGTISEILVEKGSRVRAGQALLRMDDRVLRAQVDQARAAAELARETWERRKRLWEEDRVGSELAYLEARFSAEQSAANLRTLETRLERTVIKAPVEGILEDRLVELGSLVAPGTAVARIVDVNPVKVRAGVPERYAPDVRVGARATVTFDVLPQASAEGRVEFVGAAVDARNRTFPVELNLPNADGLIKPEMVANVAVVRRSLPSAVVVPQDALVRVEDGYVVFVAEDAREGEGDGVRARVRPVRLGPSQANTVVIEDGLAPGDRLIVVGQKSVANGDRINVVGEVRS